MSVTFRYRRTVLRLLGALALSGAVAGPVAGAAAVPGTAAARVAVTDAATTPDPAGTRLLASGPSGFPDRIDVVGADAQWVVFAEEDQTGPGTGYVDGYDAVPVGGGRPIPIGGANGSLGGESLAGTTFVYYDEFGQPYWIDVATHRSGAGPDITAGLTTSWQTAVPGGGAWVQTADTSPASAVDTLVMTTTAAPDAAPTVLATLPGLGAGAHAAVADTYGIAVVAGSTVDYYSFATRTVRTLDTAGASPVGFTCTSASATVIGCFDTTELLGVSTEGFAPDPLAAAGAARVQFGPTVIAWTDRRGGRLHLVDGGYGERRFTSYDAVVSGLAGFGDTAYFSRIGGGVGGIYRASGQLTVSRVAPAPTLPRRTFRIALTAGRVAWIDDSTVAYPVRSRRLLGSGAGLRLGPLVVTAPATAGEPPGNPPIDVSFSGLDASGSRSVFVGSSPPGPLSRSVGEVLLASAGGRRILNFGDGDVALSGAHVLYGTPTGHLVLFDATTGTSRDLTGAVGPDLLGGTGDLGTALYGRYVAYARSGYGWRLDLATGRSVRAGRSTSRAGVGAVMTAGDWVISRSGATAAARLVYRNVRTRGPVRSVGGNRTLESVSQAGFVSSTPSGRQLFRTWGSTVDRPLPPALGSVQVGGGLMAWIGLDGYPRLAPFPPSAARPQALGAPVATKRVAAGRSWRLDQPTSQVLTACAVVLRNPAGRVVATLRCNRVFAGQGEAVARWTARRGGHDVPAGRYRWQLVARGAAGPVLSATGTPGTAVHGIVVVTG